MSANHLPLEGQTVTLTLGGPFYGKKLSNAVFRGLLTEPTVSTDRPGTFWRLLVGKDTYRINADHILDWWTTGPKLKVAEIGDAGYVVVTIFTMLDRKPLVSVHGVTSDPVAAKRESSRVRRQIMREGLPSESKLEVFVRPILTPAMFGDKQTGEVAS